MCQGREWRQPEEQEVSGSQGESREVHGVEGEEQKYERAYGWSP